VTTSKLHRWADIDPEQLNPHVTRQYIVGTNTMLARLVLKKGAHVPEHHHFHEQISHVVEGALKFFIDGKEIVVRAGEILCIPPHIPHAVVTLEDSVALDIFNPPRQDWIDGDDAYLRGGAAAPAPQQA
jgi:quercetin dioxygenase-like cupin family protein